MRALALLLLALLLSVGLPAAAQDLLSGDGKSESATDVLQKLLLGKVKESATSTSSGTKAAPATTERLPRKAPATAKAGAGGKDAAPEDKTAKPARTTRPPPTREADFHPLPRLKPTPPISSSPTIQPPKPIPMPADPTTP